MGDSKICLLLLLSTLASALVQEDLPTCLLAKRYKTLHKYEYQYEAESLNAINGASQLENGPKAFCKVEIEVPQTCSFVIRTTGCGLSEVVDTDGDGHPVFGPAAGSTAFAAEMERYPLKVMVEEEYDVNLFPEDGETTTILNMKRGIVSALLVPLVEEERNSNMPTIHGKCRTHSTVNARQTIATNVSLTRDLSTCDKFVPLRDQTSPLALISGMHYPLSQLIRSSQACNYVFDNDNKHMTSGSCTETHILVPFSHRGKYGVTNVGKQSLTLLTVSAHNDRIFDYDAADVKPLHMETVEDKTVIQDMDAGLALLRELDTLPDTEGERRAHLFHKLVQMVRGMKTETLSGGVPKALEVSRALTFQVLAQCGTPECSSAIMQIFRTFDSSALEVDAAVFAMGVVSNPSPLLINDMLEMAKYKPSKPIMYALSNIVKRFYKAEGRLIPEIHSVAEFMAAQLSDCSGDKDTTFMTLRVVGNMAAAMEGASPALRTAVIQCVNQPAASTAVQQAAIQVFRLSPLPDEGREVMMQVVLDGASPVQKRIAAYLVLMKNPRHSELAQLVASLHNEQDQQAKSFVISHITNVLSSTEPETKALRERVLGVLQGNEIGPLMDPTKFSGNYKIGSIEGNMIFEGTSYLPKEVMLEMTLKAFGYDIDVMEIGMEGKGFEPTVEALFGENGFFPDTTLKTMYFVSDNMPVGVTEMLKNMLPALKNHRRKRQASQGLMKEIGRNLNKLFRDLKAQQSPEAMVYLRLLGNELGYLRTNDMEEMAFSAAMMIDSMLKMFPTDLIKGVMTKTDNKIFAHYIFMDNEFFLPTATGMPLRIALSGTFTPGIKGGLNIARDMNEVSFMPSAGIEFVTQVGSHIPEYVNSGLEMHTSLFHESGLQAKISMGRDQVKMTIPAPKSPTKLISITNTLVAVSGAEVKTLPPMVKDTVNINECSPFFAGMKYCNVLQFTDASFHETAPYFPLTGNSKFAVEIHPTGNVNEYTATVAYELLTLKGEDGRQKVDTVKMVLRAEGDEPMEARATVKYNRRKNVLTTDIQIPDYDVEAGFRLGATDGRTKGKGTHSIYLDLVNKNVPQLSLVGRANLKAMKEGMLQVQILIPSIEADATVTANVKRGEEMELELKSDVKFLKSTSEQKLSLKYDGRKIEAEVKSDMSSEIMNILPNADTIKEYVNEVLDMSVGESDMQIRHILTKSVEATNNYMEKYASDIPYIHKLRIPDMPEISLPETLFLTVDTKVVYHFNDEHFTMAIPIPLGGKSTEELNFPPALTTPHFSMPQFGLEISSVEIPIPELFIPEMITISLPLFGKVEASSMVRCNIYNLEASFAAGKDVVQTPSYSAMYDVKGTSPLDVLSFRTEGSVMLSNQDSFKVQLKSSLVHNFIQASINTVEDGSLTDKLSVKSSSKIEVISPFGLYVLLEQRGLLGVDTEEISGNNALKTTLEVGPVFGNTISSQHLSIFPFRQEAKIQSSLKIESTVVQVQNTLAATFVNGELSVQSNTNVFEDFLTHVAELSFKEKKFSLKCDTNAPGVRLRNAAEASVGAGAILFKIETNADHPENLIYSLQTGTLDVNGLVINSDANLMLFGNEATHKATLKMTENGLDTSGKTSLKSPLALENTFTAGLDATGATLSINNKAFLGNLKFDNSNAMTVTLSSLDFNSNVETIVSENILYTLAVTIDLKPYTASASVNNNVKMVGANFMNEAQLRAELYKVDLTGSMKGIYGEEEIKHTYEVNYADLAASVKCSTTGKLLGAHMNHNTELEVVGLAVRFFNDARFNSQPMRFDHTMRASVVPFDFNLDGVFNADGDLTLYGRQSAQIYGKFLLRAKPLALASSHEYRASVTHRTDDGFALETSIENMMDTVLSPQEQKTHLRMKSKINDHAFNENIEMYNTAKGIGMEVSGSVFTNILNTVSENQEFSVSGFLKYDKNTNSHLIQIPFIDVTTYFENIKVLYVSIAEAFVSYVRNNGILASIDALPKHIGEFVTTMDIDGKAIQLKQYLTDFSQDYAISMEDLEAHLTEVTEVVKKILTDLASFIQGTFGMMKEMVVSGTLSETVIQKIQQNLAEINEMYDIKAIVVAVMDTVVDLIEQIDLENLRGSSMAFLREIDAKYEIKSLLEMLMKDLKQFVETFDVAKCLTNINNYISSINFEAQIMELIARIPTDIFTEIIGDVKDMIQDFKILEKINAFHAKMRGLMVKLEIDKKIEAIAEQILELIKKYKIEETIQIVVRKMNMDIPSLFLFLFEHGTSYIKQVDLNVYIDNSIKILNQILDYFTWVMNSLKYNEVVRNANKTIAIFMRNVKRTIRELEIPQKLEATIDFVNYALTYIRVSMEREIKVSEMLKTVKDIFDHTILNELKTIAEFLKQEVNQIDVEATIKPYLQLVSKYYSKTITIVNRLLTNMVKVMQKVATDQKIIGEMKQMLEGVTAALKRAELELPSFTFPLTDLVVPSTRFSMDKLDEVQIPTELTIPHFTIIGLFKVPATTISFEEIKQRIIEMIHFIVNLENYMINFDEFFGDISMNYFPAMPEVTFPKVSFAEVSFPTIPLMDLEKLVESLVIPEIQLPTIPIDPMIPCFGRVYGEIKFHTPMYTIKTTAELRNSTNNAMNPRVSAFINTDAKSPTFEVLNFDLSSTAEMAFPKRSRAVLGETLTFIHQAFKVQHQGSVTFFGHSALADAKTKIRVTTALYTANLQNTASVAMERGMNALMETNYNHIVEIPHFDYTSDVTATQQATADLDGNTLKVKNVGTVRCSADKDNHKSNLMLTINPSLFKMTFSADTDTTMFKMNQQMTAESAFLRHFRFNIRNEAEGPAVRNSLFVASGHCSLYDLKMELKANHDVELYGSVGGTFSNGVNFLIRPVEIVFDFQNKGNAKVNLMDSLVAKIELQNDYLAMFKPEGQHVNTMALARFNQFKVSYNLTVDNNEKEAGLFAAVDGEADLVFLTNPISIPGFHLYGFHTPAITNLNLYEHWGLKHVMTTTEQNINVDAKIVYQKSQDMPIFYVMDLIRIPSLGNIISGLSMKSAIINLNVNGGLYTDNDVVLRLEATTASVFEGLKAKLEGTSSLTTKRGIKLANYLSLENPHVTAVHDSSISVNTETLETSMSVATSGKITSPMLNLEVLQNLSTKTESKANALSTLKVKGDFNVPRINAVVKVEAENSLKLEGTFMYVSMESITNANFDGRVLEHYVVLGVLDNGANLYMNTNTLRSTSKVIADYKLNHGSTKVIGLDVNENLAIEASLSRVYAVLKFTSNNEVDMFTFNTKGRHVAQATMDLAPTSSLLADFEIDMSQPSCLGDLSFFQKTVVDIKSPVQKISYTGKLVTPVYTTNVEAEVKGNAPIFEVTLKSSATSPIILLEYDMDASSTANFENEALIMTNRAALTHTELSMDVNHVITQALRRKRQTHGSTSRHTLNMDITSPTFTDVNFRYAAGRDGISASVSTPSTGFLGLQVNSRVPSQVTARLYSRYASAPENDVDILVIRTSAKDEDKMNMQISYNMDAPEDMLSGLKERIPSITSAFIRFAEKHQITTYAEKLTNSAHALVREAYDTAINYDMEMSQLSIFFRNVIVRYQETVQVFLDAAVKLLRETRFKLPGSDKITTLPEVLQILTSSIVDMLEKPMQVVEIYLSSLAEIIGDIKFITLNGDVVTGDQIMEEVQMCFKSIYNVLQHMESLDVMLEKIGETTKAIVMKSQEFVDSIKSDYLDEALFNVNALYRTLITVMKEVFDRMSLINLESFNSAIENLTEMLIAADGQFRSSVSSFLQQASEESKAYIKLSRGRLELDLPFTFQQ